MRYCLKRFFPPLPVSLLFIPGAAEREAELIPVLESIGVGVQVCSDASAVLARVEASLPDTLVVDVQHMNKRGVRLIRQVQSDHPAADIPIVALVGPGEGDPRAARVLDELGIYRRFAADKPTARLRVLLENAVADAHREVEGQPNRYALDVLARVWGQEKTGILRLGDGMEATVVGGGTLDGEGTELVHMALEEGDLTFEPSEQEGLADAFSVGLAIWEAAMHLASHDFMRRMGPRSLNRLPLYERAFLLPVGDDLARLIDASNSPMPLERRLGLLAPDEPDLPAQLEALYLLGMVEFRKLKVRKSAARPGASASRAANSSVISHAPTQAGTGSGGVGEMARLHREMVAKRLRQDVERLEKADDWTVLAISPDYDLQRIQEAGARMHSRYNKMALESTVPELKSLATQMTARVERATSALEALTMAVNQYGPDCVGDDREEAAFAAGFKALRKRDYALAVRCFSAAREESMHSPRNLAYMGWAVLHDMRLSDSQRLEDASEALKISESLSPKVPTTQFFIAKLESEMGYYEDAERRLAYVIKKGGASEEARNLYMSVKQKKTGKG
jgi:CheY-like chemotaxis protein